MPSRSTALLILVLAATANAQHVSSPHASFVDVVERQTLLQSTTKPLLREAIKALPSCVATSFVAPPKSPIDIPQHYLNGSRNPAEAAATRLSSAFEKRITAGMNQYLATGSHGESACALAQLDAWAQASALLDSDPKASPQVWYQVEWTLGAAGTTTSVLVNDTTLHPATIHRVTEWLDLAARTLISYEKPTDSDDSHHDGRALAATSIGVVAADDELFRFGIDTYKQTIAQLDENGALPLEMKRHERTTHYQGFALQPLIVIAEFAERQGLDLYAFQSHGRTLRDAILFYGHAIDDPSIIKPHTKDRPLANYNSSDYAPFAFYLARFGSNGLPPSILKGLQQPTESTRLGGSTTILAAK